MKWEVTIVCLRQREICHLIGQRRERGNTKPFWHVRDADGHVRRHVFVLWLGHDNIDRLSNKQTPEKPKTHFPPAGHSYSSDLQSEDLVSVCEGFHASFLPQTHVCSSAGFQHQFHVSLRMAPLCLFMWHFLNGFVFTTFFTVCQWGMFAVFYILKSFGALLHCGIAATKSKYGRNKASKMCDISTAETDAGGQKQQKHRRKS